ALAFTGAELLAAGYAVWLLGWLLGPIFTGGGDETVRPEFFTPLGLPPRRLAAGLLTAAFVGAGPALSLLALGGLVVLGAGRDGGGRRRRPPRRGAAVGAVRPAVQGRGRAVRPGPAQPG